MRIGGLHRTSLIDFPGVLSAVVFCQGCTFRCPYCHNPDLVDPARFAVPLPWEEVRLFLVRRSRLLTGVVFSGGEPLLQDDLAEKIEEVKALGFAVKLDTNGSMPARLAGLLEKGLLDAVAMDVKGSPERYAEIAAVPVDIQAIRESIRLILNAPKVWHEFRTTVVKRFFTEEDILAVGALVAGARRFALQRFRPGGTLDPLIGADDVCSDEEMERYRAALCGQVAECRIR